MVGSMSSIPGRLDRTNHFFELPLTLRSRILTVVAAVLLIPSFFFPLYQMTLYSNQFPDGLVLKIYSYTLQGGDTPNRDDLREINSLNHYIGMRPLLESDFSEFKWLPFGIGAFVLLALRAVEASRSGGNVPVLYPVFVMELRAPSLSIRPRSRSDGRDQGDAFHATYLRDPTDREFCREQLSRAGDVFDHCILGSDGACAGVVGSSKGVTQWGPHMYG
jgi:hypothetical protein